MLRRGVVFSAEAAIRLIILAIGIIIAMQLIFALYNAVFDNSNDPVSGLAERIEYLSRGSHSIGEAAEKQLMTSIYPLQMPDNSIMIFGREGQTIDWGIPPHEKIISNPCPGPCLCSVPVAVTGAGSRDMLEDKHCLELNIEPFESYFGHPLEAGHRNTVVLERDAQENVYSETAPETYYPVVITKYDDVFNLYLEYYPYSTPPKLYVAPYTDANADALQSRREAILLAHP